MPVAVAATNIDSLDHAHPPAIQTTQLYLYLCVYVIHHRTKKRGGESWHGKTFVAPPMLPPPPPTVD